jgi:hypothetical protein
MASNSNSFIVSGTIHWACLSKPDTYGHYSFDLVLDFDGVQTVHDNARGFVKADPNKYDGSAYIKVKSKFPIKVIMDHGLFESPSKDTGVYAPVSPDKVPLVGNGSKVRCKMVPYTTKFAGKTFNKANCQLLQITHFIPYSKAEADPLKQYYDFNGTGTQPTKDPDDGDLTDELSDFL